VQTLTDQVTALDGLVWQPFAMPLVLVAVGILITIRTGFVQVRQFPLAVRRTLRSATAKPGSGPGEGAITSFQALSTALASTVGNGNIGGVATAILIGGPGAIFWMWVTAAVGMATKYAEAVLGVRYRVTRETGELASGPMYYITRGVPHAALGKALIGRAFEFEDGYIKPTGAPGLGIDIPDDLIEEYPFVPNSGISHARSPFPRPTDPKWSPSNLDIASW